MWHQNTCARRSHGVCKWFNLHAVNLKKKSLATRWFDNLVSILVSISGKFYPNSWSTCQSLCHERKKSKSSDTSSWLTFSELWFQYLRSTYAVAINDATLTCRMSRELTTNGSSNGSGRYCILHTVVMSHRFDRKNNWILIYWPCLFVEEETHSNDNENRRSLMPSKTLIFSYPASLH